MKEVLVIEDNLVNSYMIEGRPIRISMCYPVRMQLHGLLKMLWERIANLPELMSLINARTVVKHSEKKLAVVSVIMMTVGT